jgi:CubicO group peptidase (beta-lactamase class C family)
MRAYLFAFLLACSSGAPAPKQPAPPPPTGAVAPPAPLPEPAAHAPAAPAPVAPEKLAEDTPKTTVGGNTFVAPAGWTFEVRGSATTLTPPDDPTSHFVLVDVAAKDADAAVAAAWAAYKPDHKWRLLQTTPGADHDGWTDIRNYGYETSPNEKRDVFVGARRGGGGGGWTVFIYDMLTATGEKRGAEVDTIFSRLLPKGHARESFAGKQAAKLDAARIAELTKFVETAEKETGVPGVAFGIVQDGKVVYTGGVGVRELGGKQKVDGDTLFIIASNTKALTTLMLAKLVDSKKLAWDATALSVFPSFKLGNDDTTKQVLIKHLICACTGLPRQDLEWLLQYKGVTADKTMATLAGVQPTTKFGEIFQYSNLLAAAAGYIGGHVAYPKLELGAAYDKAMQTLVFDPLGMKSTTLDFARALRGNHAVPEAPDIDGKPAKALMDLNYSAVPIRPAGAGWSSVNDMLKYISMELAEGKLPDGKPYISKEPLLERRVPNVAIGKDATYGMGLMVDHTWGVTVVHHGGDLIGFHSDMMWLPEYNVGAVVLTNGNPGWLVRDAFQRKLLEVLFDGHQEADARLAAGANDFAKNNEAVRKLLTAPADPAEAAKLAKHYTNAALGDIAVTHPGKTTVFDFGEFKTEVATKKNPDGTMSFVTVAPGISDFELVVGEAGGKRTLTVRDAQHEYVFTES